MTLAAGSILVLISKPTFTPYTSFAGSRSRIVFTGASDGDYVAMVPDANLNPYPANLYHFTQTHIPYAKLYHFTPNLKITIMPKPKA